MIGPEQVVHEQRRKQRRDGVIWLVLALVLVMLLGFTYRTDRRADDGDKRLTASSTQVEQLQGQVSTNGQLAKDAKSAADEANRRLAALGKPTVPVPTEAPISPSASPPPQQDEFTAEEAAAVRLIVADQIARTPAKLTQAEISQIARIAGALVPKPADGKTPTAAELQPIISATLAAYCVDDRCVGRSGVDGKAGKDGTDGADAPAVTDEELLAAAQQALAAYCAQDSKPCAGTVGPTGPQGPQGAEGPAGRGIADTDCQEDGTWLITYSDGTKDTARGPCRIPVPPVETGN